jgi:hypothetical protein
MSDLTDPRDAMAQMLFDVAFADIANQEAKRVVFCPTADVERVQRIVDQAGLSDLLTVHESAIVPAGQLIVADAQALEAGQREALARWRL